MSPAEADAFETQFHDHLQAELDKISSKQPRVQEPVVKESPFENYASGVDAKTLRELAKESSQVPEGFHLNPKIRRQLDDRLNHMDEKVEWSLAEELAYATLLVEGVHVRISGQDSRRGTFSHRHAMWVDQVEEDKKYFPLSHLKNRKASFEVFNSPLSEYAVLGFEFGYSLFYPRSLVIWEAQYGDFANGAQIIIDQFISSSEQKWGHKSGITLMLPHGYEGQGPEHSSARLERYLQLSADDNWQIVNCTNPAQLFHVLRRQALRKSPKPLVLFQPKALLRHPLNVSPLKDLAEGKFEEILDDPKSNLKPRRVLICSGRVFYDLLAERKTDDIAIVRIEQLYPFHREKFDKVIEKYRGAELCWVQEEHSNMGAWGFIRSQLPTGIRYIGRGPSAATAAGSHALHKQQYAQMMKEAFG